MNPSFRSLVIDLLDNPNGIPESTYQNLIAFGSRNYPSQCDDIWTLTDSGETSLGLFVWLDEDDVEELRKEDAQELLEIQEIEQLQDEKRGLYPDKIDIAN